MGDGRDGRADRASVQNEGWAVDAMGEPSGRPYGRGMAVDAMGKPVGRPFG